MIVRQRNNENKAFKDQLKQQKEEEDNMLRQRNIAAREFQKSAISQNKNLNKKKNEDEAQRLKRERAQNEEMIMQQKKSEELKAQSRKFEINRQKEEQRELRAQEQAIKRQQQRLDLIRKINEENEKRLQIQAQVAMLENEESEWIKKLQNTSQVQAQAFSELENALNPDMGQTSGSAAAGMQHK